MSHVDNSVDVYGYDVWCKCTSLIVPKRSCPCPNITFNPILIHPRPLTHLVFSI